MTKSPEELRAIKEHCLQELRSVLPRYEERMRKMDDRVWTYAQGVVRADEDVHNLDEILGLRKFMRLMDTYEVDYEQVRQVVYDAEGEWMPHPHPISRREGSEMGSDEKWEWVRGGLKIDGIYGYGHYRQTPIQVYTYAWIYGLKKWKDTKSANGSRALLPSERDGENGTIWDRRRLVTEFVMMFPRKVAKTFAGAFVQFEGLMRGERDYEGYIAANSADQSRLLFEQLKGMVVQLDKWDRYFKITNSPQDRCIAWKTGTGKIAFVRALTAGGKTKDGLKAACCSADEYGAAQRTAGKAADMEGLINVIEGSMGPRREPLTVHTSTAGLGVETPYEMLINAMHDGMVEEMAIPLDGEKHEMKDDWQGGIILRPDAWERDDDEALRSERVIRKVNPNLGVTIQPDFYEKEWMSADREGDMKRKEVVTKLYNVFATDKAVDWVSADEIRLLQTDRRIEDCKASDGWMVLTGMDFTNVGDDFQASSYLAIRKKSDGSMEFFADCDLWVNEDCVSSSGVRNFLREMGRGGWLHIVSGNVLKPNLPIDRIMELRNEHGVNMIGFGYDQFKAKEPINMLKSWLTGFGIKPKELGDYVMPIGQTFGAMSPLVDELTFLVRDESRLLHFSSNPLWAWMAQNCQVIEDASYGNKRLVKAKKDYKIDGIAALLDALGVYDRMNG